MIDANSRLPERALVIHSLSERGELLEHPRGLEEVEREGALLSSGAAASSWAHPPMWYRDPSCILHSPRYFQHHDVDVAVHITLRGGAKARRGEQIGEQFLKAAFVEPGVPLYSAFDRHDGELERTFRCRNEILLCRRLQESSRFGLWASRRLAKRSGEASKSGLMFES